MAGELRDSARKFSLRERKPVNRYFLIVSRQLCSKAQQPSNTQQVIYCEDRCSFGAIWTRNTFNINKY